MMPLRVRATPSRRSPQSGYAFLLAMFMVLAMLAGSIVVIQNGLTQSKRRREEETIWRGNQYVRAIRLYFRKTGHYPQDLEALQKGLPQLHFLRQAYKNPMNQADGTWRFIYINAAGQIIGSTRYASLQQMALMENPSLMSAQGFPQLGVSASSLASQSSAFGSQPGQNGMFGGQSGLNSAFGGSPNTAPNSSPNPPPDQAAQSTTGQTTAGQNPSDQSASGQSSTGPGTQQTQSSAFGSSGQLGNPILQQKPTGPVDGPVLGGFLTGVGCPSSLDFPSLKVLRGAKKYKDWEFIWNPLADQAAATQQAIGTATQGIGGALNPFGGPNPFGVQPQPGSNPPGTNPPGTGLPGPNNPPSPQ
jgi:hypothetical protein